MPRYGSPEDKASIIGMRQTVALGTGTGIGASSVSRYFSKKRITPLGKSKLGHKKHHLHSPV